MTPSGLAPHDPAPQPQGAAGDDAAATSAPNALPQQNEHKATDAPDTLSPRTDASTVGTHTVGLHAATRVPRPVPDASVLTLDDPGPLLANGSSADVFALDDDYVLRRYRGNHDAAHEARILRHVAAHGFPVPAVYLSEGPNLLMERLHGPTLLQALAAGEVAIGDAAQILVDLHEQLHAIPPAADAPVDESQWPFVPTGPVVVHLDLHPGNVVLSDTRGPTLVDWANARAGTAELDVALSALILAEVAVDAGGDYSHAARALLAAFLVRSAVSPIDALEEATRTRRADPGLVTGERELVEEAGELVRDLIRVAS